LAAGRDEAFTALQDVAGKRWTQQSGFNSTQIQEFQVLSRCPMLPCKSHIPLFVLLLIFVQLTIPA